MQAENIYVARVVAQESGLVLILWDVLLLPLLANYWLDNGESDKDRYSETLYILLLSATENVCRRGSDSSNQERERERERRLGFLDLYMSKTEISLQRLKHYPLIAVGL